MDCKVSENELEAVKEVYDYEGKDASEAYRKSPHADRYFPRERLEELLLEDLGYFYVPVSRLAASLGIPTPVITAMIEVWATMLATDYWRMGLTLDELGLEGLTASQIVQYVNGGRS